MKSKEQITHNLSDLPMKGLGKNMDSVGLNEVVVIDAYLKITNIIFWNFTNKAIKDRAKELGANIYWKENIETGNSEIWFS